LLAVACAPAGALSMSIAAGLAFRVIDAPVGRKRKRRSRMHTIRQLAALATLSTLSAAWALPTPADQPVLTNVPAKMEPAATVAPAPALPTTLQARTRHCTACHSVDPAGQQLPRMGGPAEDHLVVALKLR
jgi:hypothetical protein